MVSVVVCTRLKIRIFGQTNSSNLLRGFADIKNHERSKQKKLENALHEASSNAMLIRNPISNVKGNSNL
jgi:hypothetical protein